MYSAVGSFLFEKREYICVPNSVQPCASMRDWDFLECEYKQYTNLDNKIKKDIENILSFIDYDD